MSDYYEKVKIELQQMKAPGEAAETEAAAGEEQLSPASESSVPADVPFTSRRGISRSRINERSRSKSRSKADGQERQVNGRQVSDLTAHRSVAGIYRVSNEQNLQVKGTAKIFKGKLAANGQIESCQRQTEEKCEHRVKEDGSKVGKKRKPVTVDSSKAKTSLEALKLSIRELKWKEVT